MKAHEVDVLALTVLRDLEEVDHTLETGLSRQFGGDIGKADRQDGVHLDLPLVQAVAISDSHVRAHPYSDAASDFAAPDSVAQAFGEDHRDSLLLRPTQSTACVPATILNPSPRLARVYAALNV
jgi:hypothetical protein